MDRDAAFLRAESLLTERERANDSKVEKKTVALVFAIVAFATAAIQSLEDIRDGALILNAACVTDTSVEQADQSESSCTAMKVPTVP